jgi:uncharacterized protein (TIGR03437 family)
MNIRLVHGALVFAVAAGALRGSDASLEQAWRQALYAVERADQGGFTARNVAQGIEVSFRTSETRLVSALGGGESAVTLRLVGYGYGQRLQQPEPARLASVGNRVEYRRRALTEWYINDARGLEQGFTLAARPVRTTGDGPLVIAMEWTGALRPELNATGAVALVDSAEHAVLNYGDLKAWDVLGRPLESRLEVQNRQVRLIVEDGRAAYPITIDPTVTATTLVAADGVSADRFGESVSVSGDTAVIGANFKHSLQGAAYVFVRSGTNWTQQAKLTASDAASGDQFGISVAVNGDTVVVGAFGKASGQGAAYVFVRSDGIWIQQAELTASDGASGDNLGISVSLNKDTAVVGASSQGSGQGAAYVFMRSGSSWTQQAKLTAADGAIGDQFGTSVSVADDTAVAGASGKGSLQGAAYVFVRSGASWAQQAKLTAADGVAGDSFGNSVSVNQDTAVVGANAKKSSQGAAYVFARSNTSWSQQAELVASDGAKGDQLGRSVSLDGNTVVAGANVVAFNTGAAYVFLRTGTSWNQQAKLTASDGVSSDQFAFSVSMSGDTVLAGAPVRANYTGLAYVFVRAGTNWTQQAEVAASDGANGDFFGWSVSMNGDTAVVGAFFKAGFQGAAYVFVRSGANWSQQAKLTASDGAKFDLFGSSVAVDGDTVVVGAYSASSKGAAYVFARTGTSWTQQAKLTASDGVANDFFGLSSSVSGDTVVIGAIGRNALQGAAYVFVRTGTSWTQQAELAAADVAKGDQFGSDVSVSGDTVVVGANRTATLGAAYVFVRSGTSWSQQAKLTAADGAKNDFFGFSVGVNGDTAIVAAYLKGSGQGAAYVFVRSGTSWSQQAKLTASDGAASDTFGHSVSLDGDQAAVGAPENNGQGAVYVFARSGTSWTQTAKLTAAGAAAGDLAGWAVALSEGTLVSSAPAKGGQQGLAYVFPLPGISSGGIVHGASFAHTVAPGSIASVFGINFAGTNGAAGSVPLPTILNGVSVTVNDIPAPLIFVGQLQANFQVPFETQSGTATVVVTVNGMPSAPATVTVSAIAPGIFTAPSNQAVVLNADNSLADSAHPAKVGSVVVMYVTGLGALDHALATGSPASSNPLSNAKVVPTVTIGGADWDRSTCRYPS